MNIIQSGSDFVPTCKYYRMEVPLKSLASLGHNVASIKKVYNDPKVIQALFSADIAMMYMPTDTLNWHSLMHTAAEMNPVRMGDTWRYPPLFVYDADDNPSFISPFNEAFNVLGVRDTQGRQLKPGDTVMTKSAEGEDIVLWEDGVSRGNDNVLFNIDENLLRERLRNGIIKNCHGATACTKELATYFRDVVGQKNVHVYHNTIVPADYQFNIKTVRPGKPDEIRILWQGSQSHLVDWMPLKEAVGIVAKKYPNTKWIFMGLELPFIFDMIPVSQYEYIPWSHYDAYKLRRTLLHVDINLCPLLDNMFNRCKSAIKWYESTVSENTEATLAQNSGPYKEITDGENGLLFNNAAEFVQKLSALIEDAALRQRLGRNAKEWVWNNRLPQHTTPGLVDFFQDLKDQQAAKLTPKIIVGGTS